MNVVVLRCKFLEEHSTSNTTDLALLAEDLVSVAM